MYLYLKGPLLEDPIPSLSVNFKTNESESEPEAEREKEIEGKQMLLTLYEKYY